MTPEGWREASFCGLGGLRSAKTQCFSLLFPIQWEPSIAHQGGRGEPWRLAAIKNSLSNIWGEESEPDDARKIGSFYPLASGHFHEARAAARYEFFLQGMRPGDEPDQAEIGACHSSRLPIDVRLKRAQLRVLRENTDA